MKITAILTAVLLCLGLTTILPTSANAKSAAQINREARVALQQLVAQDAAAKNLARDAYAVLVFPSILKGGFVITAHRGDGALLRGDRTLGYYNSTAASYGLEAGVKKFGYAMFFMDKKSLSHLDREGGWELGTAPGIVVVDKGKSVSLSTTSVRKGIYTFFFNEKGLMGGLGLEGSKITRYTPSR
ncbi:MAG TPA: YSC84-related protein [Chthoniobacterales bacterium]